MYTLEQILENREFDRFANSWNDDEREENFNERLF